MFLYIYEFKKRKQLICAGGRVAVKFIKNWKKKSEAEFPVSLFFLIDVQLIYNVVLVSGVQHSDSVEHYIYTCVCVYTHTHILFYRFFSLIGYYKILYIVSSSMQYVLVASFMLICVFRVGAVFHWFYLLFCPSMPVSLLHLCSKYLRPVQVATHTIWTEGGDCGEQKK